MHRGRVWRQWQNRDPKGSKYLRMRGLRIGRNHEIFVVGGQGEQRAPGKNTRPHRPPRSEPVPGRDGFWSGSGVVTALGKFVNIFKMKTQINSAILIISPLFSSHLDNCACLPRARSTARGKEHAQQAPHTHQLVKIFGHDDTCLILSGYMSESEKMSQSFMALFHRVQNSGR